MIDTGRMAATSAIRGARLQAGLTQEKAAALRGYATSTISRWENGGLPQTWTELQEYATALRQQIVLRFGTQQNAAPDVPERLATIEGIVRAIAAATPGVDLSLFEEIEAAHHDVDELEPDQPLPDAERRTDGRRRRGRGPASAR